MKIGESEVRSQKQWLALAHLCCDHNIVIPYFLHFEQISKSIALLYWNEWLCPRMVLADVRVLACFMVLIIDIVLASIMVLPHVKV